MKNFLIHTSAYIGATVFASLLLLTIYWIWADSDKGGCLPKMIGIVLAVVFFFLTMIFVSHV